MPAVQVTRILVYTFENNEDAERHMAHCAVPPNGTKVYGSIHIKSAAFIELFNYMKKDETDENNRELDGT